MSNQHAEPIQVPINQRITKQRQQAAPATVSRAAHPPLLPAPRWDLVRCQT
jgi:hypothetical protein